MGNLHAPAAVELTCTSEDHLISLQHARGSDELERWESPDTRAARGLLMGVLMGAGMWGVILVATGVIKL
jgi:hypothetical protein